MFGWMFDGCCRCLGIGSAGSGYWGTSTTSSFDHTINVDNNVSFLADIGITHEHVDVVGDLLDWF